MEIMISEDLTVLKSDTIRLALERIESNKLGTIFITEPGGKLLGLATDGDIRRGLLNGLKLDDVIENCFNTDCIRINNNTHREQFLKIFDHKIKVIPMVDEEGILLQVLTKENIPQQLENKVYARSKSPVRISFGGGGSDLTHYFINSGGAVINATISLFSHATLKKREDLKIILESRDLNARIEFNNLEEAMEHTGSFGLIVAVLKTIKPSFGFELLLFSDFPMKSGLGGSAVVAASIFGCFNEFRMDKWSTYEIAELAYQAERLSLGIAGGWQDQYATIFGGINFMEFQADQNLIHSLKINEETILELEESLLLCNTETIHESGDVHEDQRKEMSNSKIKELVDTNVKLTYQMRNLLLRGKLNDFGRALDTGWQLKKQFSSRISNGELDKVYDTAKANGAIGGKLLGAGGGGFFLFFVPSQNKIKLMNALESIGKKVIPFQFEPEGMRSWSVREDKEIK